MDSISYSTYFYVIEPEILSRINVILNGLAILGRITVGDIDYTLGVAKHDNNITVCSIGYKFENGIDSDPTGEVLFDIDCGISTLIGMAKALSNEELDCIANNVGLNKKNWERGFKTHEAADTGESKAVR